MEPTKLLYLEAMEKLDESAKVMNVSEIDGKIIVILDQTVFYPQGGGQAYDQGTITSNSATFNVKEVRYIEGIIHHVGTFEKGMFQPGDVVTCIVDHARRLLNSKLHSAGHLLDMAVYSAKPDWIPGKGFHFPEGPYVEYEGTLAPEGKEKLMQELEKISNEIIAKNPPLKALFTTKGGLGNYCRHVSLQIPEGKLIRIVTFGDFGVPCGDTHISELSKLGDFTIRKVKQEKDRIRISYDISR